MFGFLVSHKLRSLLSVTGITIGIFCIITIYTFTSSLEKNIRSSIDKLGDNIVYIEKWPWFFGGGTYEWWDYLNRPQPSLREYDRISDEGRTDVIDKVGFKFSGGSRTLKSSKVDLENVDVTAVHGEFLQITQLELQGGRYFTYEELSRGKNGVIIGETIYRQLLSEGEEVIGKTVKLDGRKVYILGVIKKQGETMGGPDWDNAAVVTARYFKRYVRLGRSGVNTSIVIKGHDGQTLDAVIFEVTRILRSARKLKPREDNNFAINKLTMFSETLSSTFDMINGAGLIVGFFALLVGGFGISNIMFVSVKERTGLIGVQKALGARKFFILWQFLLESILLCVIGALIGMGMVFGISLLVNSMSEFHVSMSWGIALFGLSIGVVLGVVSGVIPAIRAASMNPVEAMRRG